MSALDRVFRGRGLGQERPLAAIIAGLWRNGEQGLEYDVPGFRDAWDNVGPNLTPASAPVFGESSVISSGVYRIYSSAGAFSSVGAVASATAVIGRKYIVSFNVDSITTLGGGLLVESVENPAVTTLGPKSFLVTAVNASLHIKRGSTCDIQISGLSAKEWTGQSLCALYQDAAGTLPVYMPGQGQVDPPVGLLLDKRLGFAFGPERIVNGDFGNGLVGWSANNALLAVVAGALEITTNGGAPSARQAFQTTPGATYLLRYSLVRGTTPNTNLVRLGNTPGGVEILSEGYAVSGSYTVFFKALAKTTHIAVGYGETATGQTVYYDNISIKEISPNHAYQTTTTSRPALSARYNLLTGTESLATQSVTVVATAYTLTTAGPGSVTLSGAASGTYTAGSRMVTCTAGALTLTVLGSVTQADLRPANDGVGLPPYQRVVDANTYDTVGFPLYLKFDGVDDFLQTASIDFRGSDKVFCAASFRKLSDATTGSLFELSATIASNPGSFYITAPGAVNSGNIKLATKGTTEVNVATTAAGYPSPISAIASAVMDIAAPISTLRINGVVAKSSSASLGSGSLGNYPLYIGRRAGSSLPFNGRLYGLLIRGAATTDSTIAKVERYLNQKAKVF